MMLEVRSFQPTDREFVLRLAPRLAIGRQPWRDGDAWLTAVTGWIESSLDQHPDKAHVFIAEEDGERLGFATVTHSKHFSGQPQAYIGELVTAEGAEGRGVGTALVEACCAWAKEQGYDLITLSTGSGNPRARHFYAHLGFVEEDVTLVKRLPEGEDAS